jgi:RNA polymerase sigma factor (sigma-70 family)
MTESALSMGSHPRAGLLRLLTDDRLARSAAGGETRAFAAIFQRYHQELYRYCRAILRNDGDAEDALQNTMVRVLGALPGEEREIALRPWLYRIAHNEAISLLRRRPPLAESDGEEVAPGPEQQAETRERLRALVNDLGALPERQRGALVMRELSGVDYAEIGEFLGTSPAGARQTVYEARVALQEMAEGRATACSEVQRALSEADGRILRGRRVRAHLRGCAACQDFRAGIGQRQAAFASLAPPLPAAAAAGILHGILGGGHGGGWGGGLLGLLGGGGGKTLAASATMKSAAAVVATATIAVGTADVTGVINPPLIGGSGAPHPNVSTTEPSGSGLGESTNGTSIETGGASGEGYGTVKRGSALSRSAAQHAAGAGSVATRGPRHGRPSQLPGAADEPHRGSVPGSQVAAAHAQHGQQTAAAHAQQGQQTAAAHTPTDRPQPPQGHPTPTSHPGISAGQSGLSAGQAGAADPPSAVPSIHRGRPPPGLDGHGKLSVTPAP